jgi:peptidoglycan hydrolase-like protein with peptidoglycan-binding domain
MRHPLFVAIALAAVLPALAGSDYVQQVEERLAALGLDPGPVDGEFDSALSAAIARFQSEHDLPADGRLTRDTQAAIMRIPASAAQAPASAPPPWAPAGSASPQSEPPPSPSNEASLPPQEPAAAAVEPQSPAAESPPPDAAPQATATAPEGPAAITLVPGPRVQPTRPEPWSDPGH